MSNLKDSSIHPLRQREFFREKFEQLLKACETEEEILQLMESEPAYSGFVYDFFFRDPRAGLKIFEWAKAQLDTKGILNPSHLVGYLYLDSPLVLRQEAYRRWPKETELRLFLDKDIVTEERALELSLTNHQLASSYIKNYGWKEEYLLGWSRTLPDDYRLQGADCQELISLLVSNTQDLKFAREFGHNTQQLRHVLKNPYLDFEVLTWLMPTHPDQLRGFLKNSNLYPENVLKLVTELLAVEPIPLIEEEPSPDLAEARKKDNSSHPHIHGSDYYYAHVTPRKRLQARVKSDLKNPKYKNTLSSSMLYLEESDLLRHRLAIQAKLDDIRAEAEFSPRLNFFEHYFSWDCNFDSLFNRDYSAQYL